MRWRSLLLGIAIAAAGAVPVVHSEPGIPPIPRQERFTHRGDLSATLKAEPAIVQPNQIPKLVLVLENTGKRALRLSPRVGTEWSVQLSVHDDSGRQLNSAVCIIDRWLSPSPVRDLMVLEPGEARTFPLRGPCGGMPRMPAGEYRITAAYLHAPDWPSIFDVYEDHDGETWDGRLQPSVTVTVLPLEAETVRQLIADVEWGSAEAAYAAVYLLGLGRSTEAASAIVRRFERDRLNLFDVVLALADISDPAAVAALGAAIEQVPDSAPSTGSAPSFLVEKLILPGILPPTASVGLIPAGDGCAAISLRLQGILRRDVDTRLQQRCPDLRERLIHIRDTPPHASPGSSEYRRQVNRARQAGGLLEDLERPASPEPAPVASANSSAFEESPDSRRLQHYLRTLLKGDAWYGVEMRGLVRFGTKDTYLQVRSALARTEPDSRPAVGEILRALTFHDPATRQQAVNPRYWDNWWRTHQSMSRAQWAEGALAIWKPRSSNHHDDAWSAAHAAEYLLTIGRHSPQLVRRLAQHRSWHVRLTVAESVASIDRPLAGRLMIREFGNRYIQACHAAAEKLQQLTRRDEPSIDCTNPIERRQASAFWTRVIEAR